MSFFFIFFFFNDTATTEIYTLSLHDALPIYPGRRLSWRVSGRARGDDSRARGTSLRGPPGGRRCAKRRSEEHTSELQSHSDLVCRLLLEKKKKNKKNNTTKDKQTHVQEKITE